MYQALVDTVRAAETAAMRVTDNDVKLAEAEVKKAEIQLKMAELKFEFEREKYYRFQHFVTPTLCNSVCGATIHIKLRPWPCPHSSTTRLATSVIV